MEILKGTIVTQSISRLEITPRVGLTVFFRDTICEIRKGTELYVLVDGEEFPVRDFISEIKIILFKYYAENGFPEEIPLALEYWEYAFEKNLIDNSKKSIEVRVKYGIDIKKSYRNGEIYTTKIFNKSPSKDDINDVAEHWGEQDDSGKSHGYELLWEEPYEIAYIKKDYKQLFKEAVTKLSNLSDEDLQKFVEKF